MKPEATGAHDFRALTGIRGIAALWVLVSHFLFMSAYNAGLGNRLETGPFFAILEFDFIGVDIFLMLSGFFLYMHYRDYFVAGVRGWKIDKFYLLRIARLWPVHVFTLGLIAFCQWQNIPHPLASHQETLLRDHWPIVLALNLTMMQAWGIIAGASWNEPAWTVSALFFVYIIFPAWVGLVKRCNTLASQIFGIVAMLLLLEIVPHFIDGLSMVDGFGCLLRTFTLFMTGCLTYRLFERGWLSGKYSDVWFIVVAVLLLGGITFFVNAADFPLFFLHLLYPPLLLSLAYSKGIMHRVFTSRLMLWLGAISYSFYMVHYPILVMVKHWWGSWYAALPASQPQLWAHFMVLAAIIAAVSWLCYRFIEQPVYLFVHRRLQLRQ